MDQNFCVKYVESPTPLGFYSTFEMAQKAAIDFQRPLLNVEVIDLRKPSAILRPGAKPPFVCPIDPAELEGCESCQ